MEKHQSEPITIEEIAHRSGWSHEHFTRVFVASVGTTPKRMLLERRIIRAESMMMMMMGEDTATTLDPHTSYSINRYILINPISN
jgi:methylphosphotriester-DNA--protein-cysteine methyltransferase